MLIQDLKGNITPFDAYKDLLLEQEINKLDILSFSIPSKFKSAFKNEYIIKLDNQDYVIKNIEPYYNDYLIECKQDISDWYIFNDSLNFPYKPINDVLEGIKPNDWQIVILDDITQKRTITADHKMSSQVVEELKDKYGVEIRYDNRKKKLIVGFQIAEDNGAYFSEELNLKDKVIKTESFEFATRIIPEGMNGLMINQVNEGKEYLENKSYSPKTITYYWKDERYTNIQNLKDAAQAKLDILSKPFTSIELKVQDLSRAIGVANLKFELGDYVHHLDKDNKSIDLYRIIKLKRYDNDPLKTEIVLNNKPLDLVDDEKSLNNRIIELTSEMWEKTRVRFETTEDAIRGYVETQRRESEEAFKTYKAEREMTDRRIYEKISETTTYVDPVTGQTQPIVDKQLEIDKSLDGIKIELINQQETNDANIQANFQEIEDFIKKVLDSFDASLSSMQGDVLAYKQAFDIANGEVNSEITALRHEIDQSGDDIKNYIHSNYSTRNQTDALIEDKMGNIRQEIGKSEEGVKKYVEENYSTRTQTSTAIQSEVRTIKNDVDTAKSDASRAKSTADSAYSQALQTAGEVSVKVGKNDVYSIIQQLPSYVKIDAKNINMTGDVDVVGTFKTSSYGKRIELSGSQINFYNQGGEYIGRVSMEDYGRAVYIGGPYGLHTGINMGGNYERYYSQIINGSVANEIYGGLALNELQAMSVLTAGISIDKKMTNYGETILKGKTQFGEFITLTATSTGQQLQFKSDFFSKSFIIDFSSKTTFWA
ncbi:phage tail protein [Anaerococcus cruorum]|uniref:Phage tail protein n=1 Tax=Anaerococcus cruorum TaxID=3115617 RepID=A0ABW9MWE1_9FIRM